MKQSSPRLTSKFSKASSFSDYKRSRHDEESDGDLWRSKKGGDFLRSKIAFHQNKITVFKTT